MYAYSMIKIYFIKKVFKFKLSIKKLKKKNFEYKMSVRLENITEDWPIIVIHLNLMKTYSL